MKLVETFFPDQDSFKEMIKTMASSDIVRNHVILNHDDNRWWPNYIHDWRIRMLVAGLSSRISYSMVNTYSKVVKHLDQLGYDALNSISDEEFKTIIKSIGLTESRLVFKKSLFKFIEELEKEKKRIEEYDSSTLIQRMSENVKGAGYKVAQCCVLYAKGYHCGIMPVDSGMKDVLGYCLGFNYPDNALGHEVLRKQFELLTNTSNFAEIIETLGYDKKCTIPSNVNWWVHLVLIYYKRFYCNKCDPANCLLQNNPEVKIGSMCSKKEKQRGGISKIIIEGVDGVGKTTLAKKIKGLGYKHYHFEHNKNTNDLYSFYKLFFLENKNTRLVLDRSYISEYVYGNALRGASRISKEQIIKLTEMAGNPKIIIITDEKEQILSREISESDRSLLSEKYELLTTGYLDFASDFKSVLNISVISSIEARDLLLNDLFL